MIKDITRFARTMRYLRFEQIVGQIRVRLKGTAMKMAVSDEAGLSAVSYLHDAWDSCVGSPVPLQSKRDIAQGAFTFIGKRYDLGDPIDWGAADTPKLWRYNLHYFDWLWSLLSEDSPKIEKAIDLTADWIERYRPDTNAILPQCGWEPYPMSLRLINWTFLFGIRHREEISQHAEFETRLMSVIRHQTEWLSNHLETHLRANHLLENLAAVACVTAVYKWDGSTGIRDRILPRLKQEIDEQILVDGMHYERSPMYHLRMRWLMQMLSSLKDEELEKVTQPVLGSMNDALCCLRHPNGEIPLFNDASLGVYQDDWQDQDIVPSGSWALADAGYYGFRDEGDYVAIDAAPVGPDYQPGHAHADFFTFEMSLGGKKIITDTGVSSYEKGAARDYDRSTTSHNTLEIDGGNSVEVWGGFRVGRRSVPRILEWTPSRVGFQLSAEHSGYSHLPCRAVHRRDFTWDNTGFRVQDEVEVCNRVKAVSRIHLAPSVSPTLEGNVVECTIGNIQFQIQFDSADGLRLAEANCCQNFGEAEPHWVIEKSIKLSPPQTSCSFRVCRV